MPEARPCLREKQHVGLHTPDLTNLKNAFGFVEILTRASDYINPTSGERSTRWVVEDKFGGRRTVTANHLFSTDTAGRMAARGSGLGSYDKKNRPYPEYVAIKGHYDIIFNKRRWQYVSYKNMLFFDDWNPKKGGSIITGAHWIRKHLGPKPGRDYQLHVLKTKKHPYGFFGPGGIVWRSRMDRHDQDVLDLVAEWSDEKWRKFIETESRRRGHKND
jgi:hypothetical protein